MGNRRSRQPSTFRFRSTPKRFTLYSLDRPERDYGMSSASICGGSAQTLTFFDDFHFFLHFAVFAVFAVFSTSTNLCPRPCTSTIFSTIAWYVPSSPHTFSTVADVLSQLFLLIFVSFHHRLVSSTPFKSLIIVLTNSSTREAYMRTIFRCISSFFNAF